MRTRAIRNALAAVFVLLVAACADHPVSAPDATQTRSFTRAAWDRAPVYRANRDNKGKPDEYIVVLNHGAMSDGVTQRHRVLAQKRFRRVVNGFAARLSKAELEKLQGDVDVKYVQEDIVPTLAVLAPASAVSSLTVQSGVTWGIDRIDQRDLPLSGTYNYTNNGTGVNVYMIDSGILTTHTEFATGRAKAGINGYDAFGGDGEDCYGHGTHTAATVGGATYGVAKKVTLYSVRIFDCSGVGPSLSAMLGAFEWIINHKVASGKPAVSSSSWVYNGWIVPVIDDAFLSMTANGIVNVVAAGNSATDACLSTPAHVPSNITVAATDEWDNLTSFSNRGSCVDILAPGNDIESAYWTSNTATAVMTGTSMATPHVAGVVAQFLQRNKTADPALVTEALLDVATYNRVRWVPAGTPNLLLHRLNGLLSAGTSTIVPGSLYYCTTELGQHNGYLQGTAGTDFNLKLQRWNGTSWVTVQSRVSTSSKETISWTNTSFTGTQRWRYVVNSVLGAGSFDLYIRRPGGPPIWDATAGTSCP